MTYLSIFVVLVVVFVVVFSFFWCFKGLKQRITDFVILKVYKNKAVLCLKEPNTVFLIRTKFDFFIVTGSI